MDLTPEEIKMLGQQERQMDKGEVPFVINKGQRLAMIPEVMEFFELEQGQSVNDLIVVGILQKNIELCRQKSNEVILDAEYLEEK